MEEDRIPQRSMTDVIARDGQNTTDFRNLKEGEKVVATGEVEEAVKEEVGGVVEIAVASTQSTSTISAPSPLFNLSLEIRYQIFESLILTPYTITISLSEIENCLSPIEILSKTCKQLRDEIMAWSTLDSILSYLRLPVFGMISHNTTLAIRLFLTRRESYITISKNIKNEEEAAVFRLWRDIMFELNTSDMDKIDREIRERVNTRERRVMIVLNRVYEDIVSSRGMNDVKIDGGNRYWVITTIFWGMNLCGWEGPPMYHIHKGISY